MRLLLVEDNERLATFVRKGLVSIGFSVDVLGTAEDAIEALKQGHYDTVVLDLGLPDGDGTTVLADLRRRRDATPVLVLTARGTVRDRVEGLNAGADDYLMKPFAFEELAARLQAILRRRGELVEEGLTYGNVTLDRVGREVTIAGQPHVLSARETALLESLMRRAGRVVPKNVLEDQLYGLGESVTSNAVEVHVHRLRKRLADLEANIYIHTFRGVGYMISEKAPQRA